MNRARSPRCLAGIGLAFSVLLLLALAVGLVSWSLPDGAAHQVLLEVSQAALLLAGVVPSLMFADSSAASEVE